MSTPLVISVTDELVAELEAIAQDASFVTRESDSQEYLANLATRLLAERAELLRDADCLQWLLDQGDNTQWQNILRIEVDDYATVRDAINEVMRQECKP